MYEYVYEGNRACINLEHNNRYAQYKFSLVMLPNLNLVKIKNLKDIS